MKFPRRLSSLFRRRQLDAEMTEEMRLHLDLQAERNRAAGMEEGEARYAALRQFGNVASVQEHARAARGWPWLDDLSQDVRFAFRGLRRNPGFTTVAVLTLALGIGVNTSMFTALQAVLLRELPYPDSDRLVQVFRTSPHSQRWPHAPANFLEQRAENDVFTQLAAVNGKSFNLAEPGQPPERVGGLQVTADWFPLLGVAPALGRVFTPEEDRPGSNAVAVLEHQFWQRRFAGDPEIIGRTLRLDGETITVVGVMPPGFGDRQTFGSVDVWRPMAFSETERQNRGGNYLKSYARLKPGVSLAQARTAMAALAAKQEREHPDNNTGIGLRLVPLADAMDPRGRLALWLTMALAGFVLLIACANLANLQFARTARRTQELAIRGALGAPRNRLLRQLLTESLVIALLGGMLGVVLAGWANELLGRQLVRDGDALLKLQLNLKVLGFALGVSTLAGFAFGLVPAWLASRASAAEAMKQGARGATGDRARRRMQHALIVTEMALALILMSGAGLVIRGLQRFTLQDPGWRVGGLTIGTLSLPDRKYAGADAQQAFATRLQEKLAALPGVEGAALAWSLPVREFNTAGDFQIDGRPEPTGHHPIRFVNAVTTGYFETLGMQLLVGRNFTAADGAGAPAVVIINEAMARAFWAGQSPLGQRIEGEEIIGVVSDVRFATDPSAPSTQFQTYRPFAQNPRGYLAVAVRGAATAETLRRVVAELDADQPVINPGPASAEINRALANLNLVGALLGGFGGLGLLLASLGIYGVIAGFVAQRTNEIGIRMALGAQVRDVLQLVVGRGLRLTLVGAVIGISGSLVLARLLAAVVPAFSVGAPLAILLVTVLLVTVAFCACWLPAQRAAKIDPIRALRSE